MKNLKVEMSRNNDYITENSLDYLYQQNYYKLISTDLSKESIGVLNLIFLLYLLQSIFLSQNWTQLDR